MKRITVFSILLFLGTAYANDKLLSKSDILFNEPLPWKNACIAHQSFKKIGPSRKNLFAHEIVVGYRYDNNPNCPRATVNGALYIQEGDSYRQIYDHGEIDPATYISLRIYEHPSFLIFSATSNDGGGIYGIPHVFVLDDEYKLHSIEISKLEKWANSQLGQGQRIVELASGVDYSKQPITFGQRIFNEKDHYRHPTGGTLSAKLQIVKEGDVYKLDIINRKHRESARDLNEDGLKLYRRKEYKEAVEFFKRATAIRKTYWMAWNNQASALYKLGDYKKSIDASWVVYTGKDISRNTMANAAYNIAKSYEALGNLPHALKFYESANDLAPNKARKKAIEVIKKKINNN